MIAAIRLRRLLAEDEVTIHAFDQKLHAGRLYYDRPMHPSLEVFQAARRSTAAILEITEAQWARQGTHSESGRSSPEKWLEISTQHAHTRVVPRDVGDLADLVRRVRRQQCRARALGRHEHRQPRAVQSIHRQSDLRRRGDHGSGDNTLAPRARGGMGGHRAGGRRQPDADDYPDDARDDRPGPQVDGVGGTAFGEPATNAFRAHG